jgi:hypothetical protein
MIRSVPLFLLLAFAGAARAQDPLPALREASEKASTQWEALAKGLEPKIARLLPCDPTSHAAVEEVSHASEARLAALSALLKAEADRARNETEAAKQVLAAQATLSGAWNAEHAEAGQQQTAIAAQIADLKESMRKRGALASAGQVLVEISLIVKQRAAKSDAQAGRKDSLNKLLGDLVVSYQDRQTAIENESALLDSESAKWSAYYTARLARTVTECTIINPNANKRKP